MATTHSRNSVSTDASSFYTIYTNSTAKAQRILVTDVHFAADSGQYGSNMNSFSMFITKRGSGVSSTMNSSILDAYVQYPYSLYANFTGSHGGGSVLFAPDASQPGVQHFTHYGSTYSSTPFASTSYILNPYLNSSQFGCRGPGQCVLYPSDSIRVGTNKYGTLYTDFLIISE